MSKGGYDKLLRKFQDAAAENLRLRSKLMESEKAISKPPEEPAENPIRDLSQPLNKTDSFALVGILVGTLFVLFTPTAWQKMPAFAMLCLGIVYFIWRSHWTHRGKPFIKILATFLILGIVSYAVVPQFLAQWRMEHLHSELAFDANLPGVGYLDGDHYGIKWKKNFVEARLNVTSTAQYPVQNLNLSVSLIDKPGTLAGMAQADQEPQGCVIRKPRENFVSHLILRGTDGSRVDVAPFTNDQTNALNGGIWDFRDHYDLLCQRILVGESIPLVLAVVPQNAGSQLIPSSNIHIKGDYETTVPEGSKRITVDETVPITMLPPWK